MDIARMILIGLFCSAPCFAQESRAFLANEQVEFLAGLAQAVVEASRVPPNAVVAGEGPNSTGNTLIRPGGRGAYPAFWIRDYAMSLDAGIISAEEQRHALLLTARNQVDTSIILPSGSLLPPGSIPDHISFTGKPIFFPGVLSDYMAQGGPRWGLLPCLDDQFYFIHMAAQFADQTKNTEFLKEAVRGKTLLHRLEAAYAMPPSQPDTGLVCATESVRGVNFGFFDCVVHTGNLFFCSLLKFQAAQELAYLLEASGGKEQAQHYRDEAARISNALAPTFALGNGWYRASTGQSAQPDVWGTAFAVYIGALPADLEKPSCQTLADALRQGSIAWKGAIRHVPMDADFSETSAWEKCLAKKDTYQNGAYWNTPIGWVCYAVAKTDFAQARELANAYIEQLRADDFRKGDAFGSPWECMHEKDNHRQNPVYMASVTLPLAAFRRIAIEH